MKALEPLVAGAREFARVFGLYIQQRRVEAVAKYKKSHDSQGRKKVTSHKEK